MSTLTLAREDAEFFHDQICGDLVVLKMQLDHFRKRTTNASQKRELKSMGNLVDQIICSIRERSRTSLRAVQTEPPCLYTQISRCVRRFEQRTRIRTYFRRTGDDKDVSNGISVTVLEILKESLTNIVRHAKATEVRVDAVRHQRFLAISICDNGAGAGKCAVQNPAGVGLLTIERKISALGGTVEFRCAGGQGFEVFLRIPVGLSLPNTDGVHAHSALTKNVHRLATDIRRIANVINERAQAIVR